MITDTMALTEIQESWKGVEALRDKLQRAHLAAFSDGPFASTFAADAAQNLPFVHACSVLNDVLEQLAAEGHFKCKSHFLGALISASKGNVPWRDIVLIEELVNRRNDIAHRADMLTRKDCWRYIDAIKEELVSWRIVPT